MRDQHHESAEPAVRERWLAEETTARRRLSKHEGVIPTELLAQRSGIDLLRAILAGELPPPPIGRVADYLLVDVESGHATFQGTPKFEYYSPIGSVHGGWIATLLDSCVGCAVLSVLPAGKGFTTLELKVNFVRKVTDRTGPLRAEGRIVHSGARVATAEGRLLDAAGRLYAHASTTCLIFDLGGREPPTQEAMAASR
jgi:uncharacterized protein (TIGR00369 family)